jgi:hypothetical protein
VSVEQQLTKGRARLSLSLLRRYTTAFGCTFAYSRCRSTIADKQDTSGIAPQHLKCQGMSRGLGRIEREILDTLRRQRQIRLADRWHPLLARSAHRVNSVDALTDEPNSLGPELIELRNLVATSERPHAAEVSVQRAAKRLAEKGLIERRRLWVTCRESSEVHRRRDVVCVRIAPTPQEVAAAQELRERAANVWLRVYAGGFNEHAARLRAVGNNRELGRLIEQRKRDQAYLKWFDGL